MGSAHLLGNVGMPEVHIAAGGAKDDALEGDKPRTWVERPQGDAGGKFLPGEQGFDIPAANRDAFVAFSAGGRSCVGARFATLEATVLLASLLRRLKFSSTPGFELWPWNVGVVQKPRDGLPMVVTKRVW